MQETAEGALAYAFFVHDLLHLHVVGALRRKRTSLVLVHERAGVEACIVKMGKKNKKKKEVINSH